MGVRNRTVYLTAQYDADELSDELTTEELVAELKTRGVESNTAIREAIREAIRKIRAGQANEAADDLEAEFFPKWETVADSKAAYDAARTES